MRYRARVGGRRLSVEVTRRGAGRYSVRSDGRERRVEARPVGGATILTIDGRSLEGLVGREPNGGAGTGEKGYAVSIAGHVYRVRLADPLRQSAVSAGPRTQGPMDVRSI